MRYSPSQHDTFASDLGEEVKAEPRDELGEQSGRLLLRLLLKYLQSASSKPAEAASNNAIHMLHYLVHPDRPASRYDLSLLSLKWMVVLEV